LARFEPQRVIPPVDQDRPWPSTVWKLADTLGPIGPGSPSRFSHGCFCVRFVSRRCCVLASFWHRVLAALVLPHRFAARRTVGCRLRSFLQRGGGVLLSNAPNQAMTMRSVLDGRLCLDNGRAPACSRIASSPGAVMNHEGRGQQSQCLSPNCGRYLGALFGSNREPPPPTQRGTADNSAFAEGHMAIPVVGPNQGLIATTIEIRFWR